MQTIPDYSLGRAHGEIQIDYDGSGADKAARDLDKVVVSSEAADKSLGKTQRTLGDTEKQYSSTGDSAAGYSRRLKDVEASSKEVETAERNHRRALLDSKSSLDDIKVSEERLTEARKKHTQVTDSARAAQKALVGEMSGFRKIIDGLSNVIPGLSGSMDKLGKSQQDTAAKSKELSGALGLISKAALALGQPEIAAAAKGVDAIGSAASGATSAVTNFAGSVAGFEVAFGKIAGLTLGVPSLAGLAGLGGGAALQGVVELADAAKQLSGVLGLLPAVMAGVELSSATLNIAFQGVGGALKDMMAADPKKFLEDIKNMGPVTAEAMLQVAQFRDKFRMAGGAIQDSFFGQVAKDISPLIQTLLPTLTSGMSKIAATFGWAADEVARLMSTPAAQQGLTMFMDNIVKGLQALEPAIQPLFNIFDQLTVVGSGFFQEIGGMVSQFLGPLAAMVERLASSGQLQAWIQDGINAFSHLVNIAGNVASAFAHIMDIADKFGGGGFLGWLDKLTDQFNKWTQSADGQKSLTDFFTVLQQATDALMPMLPPLVDGLLSIGTAIVKMGIGTAPGWQIFFDSFAKTMADLAPNIAAIGPQLVNFLAGVGQGFQQLMGAVGPQLPGIFRQLSDAFRALIPQLQPLIYEFLQFVEQVGPQLPGFFEAVTSIIIALQPEFRTITTLVELFVAAIAGIIRIAGDVINWLNGIGRGADDLAAKIPGLFHKIMDGITDFFSGLPEKALHWGESLINGLVDGITNGLGSVGGAAKDVVEAIAKWFQSSPAKVGPFSGAGYTLIRGQRMVTDMAAGMTSARPAIEAAAAETAAAASGGLAGATGTPGGAPSAGGSDTTGGALLPDNIAGANTSILTAYLRHQFSDTNGLKGLAKDLGEIVKGVQSGANLISQHVLQPLFQGLGMLPGAKDQAFRKMTPEELAAQQQKDAAKDAAKQGPGWDDVFGKGAPGTSSSAATGDGASVPLVQNPDGTWTSPNAAWAHLIQRESSGVNQVQSPNTRDVNSGGNEAEGLFQITPKTWQAHGGTDLAPNPLAATPQQQATIAARILQGNPSGSDWGAGLAGRENAAELLAGLTGAPAPGAKAPGWFQINGTGPAPASAGVQSPTGRGIYLGAHVEDTGGKVVPNVAAAEEIVKHMFPGVSINNDYRPKDGYNEHSSGEAIDFSINPGGKMGVRTPEGQAQGNALRDFLIAHADQLGLEYGLWDQTQWNPDGTSSPMEDRGGVTANHGDHFHGRFRPGAPPAAPAGTADYANWYPAAPAKQGIGVSATTGVQPGLVLPSGKPLDDLLKNTDKSATANDQLLQSYLKGNPALASQIDAAKTPGASDGTVMDTLSSISTTIDSLKTQDAVGNKNTIDALQSAQSGIAQQQGFTQTKGPLDQAQSIASGISGAVSGVFQSIQSGLDALAATQDITDHLVYGVRNSEDIAKTLVDDVQKYITFAADVIGTIGSIVSTAGSFTGGADMGGTGAAGSALSLISSILQGVNAAIDFGQQVYEITMGYVGKFATILGGLGGSDMMGNIGFLLNTNNGTLQQYSMDNPQLKNSHNVPTWMDSWYNHPTRGNPNPQVNQQLNVYAGPGQSTAEMMNETMWMVNTQGTTGALAPANF